MTQLLYKEGKLQLSKSTMQHTSRSHLFAGGDIIGTNNLVDAVNDGKVASWSIHRYLGGLHKY